MGVKSKALLLQILIKLIHKMQVIVNKIPLSLDILSRSMVEKSTITRVYNLIIVILEQLGDDWKMT